MSDQRQSQDNNSIHLSEGSMESPRSPKKLMRLCTNCGRVGNFRKICSGDISENIKRMLNVTDEKNICTPCLLVGDLMTKTGRDSTLNESDAPKHIRECTNCKVYGHYTKTSEKLESC